MFALEQAVNIKYTTLSGVVKGASIDNVTLEVQYLVEYTDVHGEVQSRYFPTSSIEAA